MRVEIVRCLLYDLIHSRGMTPQQFADKIGVDISQLSQHNSGSREMSIKNALFYSDELGCSVNDLYEYRVIS